MNVRHSTMRKGKPNRSPSRKRQLQRQRKRKRPRATHPELVSDPIATPNFQTPTPNCSPPQQQFLPPPPPAPPLTTPAASNKRPTPLPPRPSRRRRSSISSLRSILPPPITPDLRLSTPFQNTLRTPTPITLRPTVLVPATPTPMPSRVLVPATPTPTPKHQQQNDQSQPQPQPQSQSQSQSPGLLSGQEPLQLLPLSCSQDSSASASASVAVTPSNHPPFPSTSRRRRLSFGRVSISPIVRQPQLHNDAIVKQPESPDPQIPSHHTYHRHGQVDEIEHQAKSHAGINSNTNKNPSQPRQSLPLASKTDYDEDLSHNSNQSSPDSSPFPSSQLEEPLPPTPPDPSRPPSKDTSKSKSDHQRKKHTSVNVSRRTAEANEQQNSPQLEHERNCAHDDDEIEEGHHHYAQNNSYHAPIPYPCPSDDEIEDESNENQPEKEGRIPIVPSFLSSHPITTPPATSTLARYVRRRNPTQKEEEDGVGEGEGEGDQIETIEMNRIDGHRGKIKCFESITQKKTNQVKNTRSAMNLKTSPRLAYDKIRVTSGNKKFVTAINRNSHSTAKHDEIQSDGYHSESTDPPSPSLVGGRLDGQFVNGDNAREVDHATANAGRQREANEGTVFCRPVAVSIPAGGLHSASSSSSSENDEVLVEESPAENKRSS